MTYVKQTWANSPAGATPINATRLNHIEDGLEDAAAKPHTTDAVIYLAVSAYASDANDGLSAGSPKLTLAAAVAAIPVTGGTIIVLNGDHNITLQVTLKSNLTIEGLGYRSNLVLAVSDIGIGGTDLSNVTIKNLRVSGSSHRAICFVGTATANIKVQDNWVSGATVSSAANYAAGIFLSGASNCEVSGNKLSGNGIGASANRSADIFHDTATGYRNKIFNNTCESTAVHFNIGMFNQVNTKILGNHCSGAIADASANSGYGIMIYDQAAVSKGNVVVGNTVVDTQGKGIYLQTSHYSIANNNICENNGTVEDDTTLAVGGVVLNNCLYSEACLNIVKDSGKDGIAISGTGTGNVIAFNTIFSCAESGVRVRGTNNSSVVEGNTIVECRRGVFVSGFPLSGISIKSNTIKTTSALQAGIDTGTALTDFAIVGNIIDGAGGYGIATPGGGSRGVISQNIVKNSGSGNPGVYDGMHILTTETLVTDNQSYNDGTVFQNYGIRDGSAGTGNVYSNNKVNGNVTGGIIAPAPARIYNNDGIAGKEWAGTGVPANTFGENGDFFNRSDGTVAGATLRYHKEAGAWVAYA